MFVIESNLSSAFILLAFIQISWKTSSSRTTMRLNELMSCARAKYEVFRAFMADFRDSKTAYRTDGPTDGPTDGRKYISETSIHFLDFCIFLILHAL